jgi:uncharacterized protein (TIGR03089 family)
VPNTPAGLLAAVLAADPARPLITQYDDATGERIELSAVTFDNWVAKTANLIQDAGHEAGAVAAVLLPAHWQGAAIMIGCWSAGLSIAHGHRGGPPESADIAFAAAGQLPAALQLGADDVFGLSLAPLGAPLRDVPPGVTDYATEVRVHGDRFVPFAPVDPQSPALVGELGGRGPISHSDLVGAASKRAAELGLSSGDRLLVTDAPGAGPRPLDWLLTPLAAGVSIVLSRNPDPAALDRRAAEERVTVTLNCDVTGVRRA